MVNVNRIEDKGQLLALIVNGEDYSQGVSFPTENNLIFQLGLHNQKKGTVLASHRHFPIKRLENVNITEVFYIKKGKVKISLYSANKKKVKDIVAISGDIVYLICGHGFEFLEDTIMFELKQGPYRNKSEDKEMII